MKTWAALPLLLLTAGCSTAPIADLMDHFHPSTPGTQVAVHRVPVVAPQPVKVEAVTAPKLPSGPLPVAPPATEPGPPVEPLPQPKPVPEGEVRSRFRPSTEVKPTQPVAPKSPVLPAVFRSQHSELPDSLPSHGVTLPR